MSTLYSPILVWSRNIRLFHWINVICILLLIMIGTIILNAKTLGVVIEGKVLLKTLHVGVGYLFAINLLIRIALGFIGKNYERWGKTLPFTQGFTREFKDFYQGKKKVYKGHNPAGKLMILLLFITLTIQMISGLVIAGTDIYYPPFG